MITKLISQTKAFLRKFRRKATTQVVLPELDRMLFALLRFDQANLNTLLASEPRQGHLVDSAKNKVQEHTKHLISLLEGKLTPEQEAELFRDVQEDWKLCQEVTTRLGINLNNNSN